MVIYHIILLKGVVTFTLDELQGVPPDVISGYTKRTEESKEVYDVTFKTPDIFPIVSFLSPWTLFSCIDLFRSGSQFKYAQNPETRRLATEAFEARLEINVPILRRALELRRKIAKVLEYPTWADYVTEEKMVKSSANATEVCSSLLLLFPSFKLPSLVPR